MAICAPLPYTRYRVTPTLSVEARQLKSMRELDTAAALKPVGIEGGVLSGPVVSASVLADFGSQY